MQDTAAANDASLEKLRLASRSEIKRLKLEIADLREKLGNTENALAAASEVAITAPVKRDSEIVAALKETNEVCVRLAPYCHYWAIFMSNTTLAIQSE